MKIDDQTAVLVSDLPSPAETARVTRWLVAVLEDRLSSLRRDDLERGHSTTAQDVEDHVLRQLDEIAKNAQAAAKRDAEREAEEQAARQERFEALLLATQELTDAEAQWFARMLREAREPTAPPSMADFEDALHRLEVDDG